MARSRPTAPLVVGRYAIFGEIAAGGMATVHFGRLMGPVGFSRTVAIKRLHAQFAKDPEFVSMFLDEARLAARVVHPNAVQTLDVVAAESELFLVLEYVQGESLARLIRAETVAKHPIPLDIVSAIICGLLHGLHAAHEATGNSGESLDIVHRDVSPHNVLIGADGVARVIDFGVAKATGRVQTTREGQLKGKLCYMAPEQLRRGNVDRRTDIFAAGIVLWEMLTLRRLFKGESEAAIMMSVLDQEIVPPSTIRDDVAPDLDEVVARALERDKALRFASAKEMALALEAAVPIASPTRISGWVTSLAGEVLAQRAQIVRDIETNSGVIPESAATTTTANGSQVSTISVSSNNTRVERPRRHRDRYLIGGGVTAGAVAAIGLFAVLLPRPATEPSYRPSTAAVAPSETSPVVTPAHDSDPPPPPSAITAPSAASSVAPTPSPAPAIAVRTTPRPTVVRPAASAPSTKGCTIRPYIDESGLKKYIEECK